MGFYRDHIMPVLIDRGMRVEVMTEQRAGIMARAEGQVLEVGIGSGLNIPHYTDRVSYLFGLEPLDKLRAKALPLANAAPFPVEFVGLDGAEIPLDSHAMDMVVTSWTLCSIPAVERALQEFRRVLKPNGRFMFIEHGRAPEEEENTVKWQDRFTPLFRCLAGCHPNRKIDRLISEAGFRFDELKNICLRGPKILSYHYIGVARPE